MSSVEILTYLELRFPTYHLTDEETAAILRDGSLDLFKWFYNKGYLRRSHHNLAKYGRRDILKYLTDKDGVEHNERICAKAVWSPNPELIFWLHDLGYPWDDSATFGASKTNNLPLLQQLLEKGCPWDDWIPYHFARHHNLEALKWLHMREYPFTHNSYMGAIGSISNTKARISQQTLEILDYLLSINCPG